MVTPLITLGVQKCRIRVVILLRKLVGQFRDQYCGKTIDIACSSSFGGNLNLIFDDRLQQTRLTESSTESLIFLKASLVTRESTFSGSDSTFLPTLLGLELGLTQAQYCIGMSTPPTLACTSSFAPICKRFIGLFKFEISNHFVNFDSSNGINHYRVSRLLHVILHILLYYVMYIALC